MGRWIADLVRRRDNARIGTITGTGTILEAQIPPSTAGPVVPQGIVVGPAPDVWFTDQQNDRIGQFPMVSQQMTFYAVPTAFPLGLVRGGRGRPVLHRTLSGLGRLQIAASNGYLWTTGNSAVYRIDPRCECVTKNKVDDRTHSFLVINAGRVNRNRRPNPCYGKETQ